MGISLVGWDAQKSAALKDNRAGGVAATVQRYGGGM